MNKKFKKLLRAYREDEFLEEIDSFGTDRYKFIDEYDGYTYTVNNVNTLKISDYFKFIDDNKILELQSKFFNICNLKKLEKTTLSTINSEMFLNLDSIIILMDKEDEIEYSKYIDRDVSESWLGQTNCDTNTIVINLYRIMIKAKEIENNEVDFFETSVYQFYLTLLHELGHSSLRVYEFDEELNFSTSPLTINSEIDEEELVEEFARNTFVQIDSKYNIFDSFDKEYFFNFFNNN